MGKQQMLRSGLIAPQDYVGDWVGDWLRAELAEATRRAELAEASAAVAEARAAAAAARVARAEDALKRAEEARAKLGPGAAEARMMAEARKDFAAQAAWERGTQVVDRMMQQLRDDDAMRRARPLPH